MFGKLEQKTFKEVKTPSTYNTTSAESPLPDIKSEHLRKFGYQTENICNLETQLTLEAYDNWQLLESVEADELDQTLESDIESDTLENENSLAHNEEQLNILESLNYELTLTDAVEDMKTALVNQDLEIPIKVESMKRGDLDKCYEVEEDVCYNLSNDYAKHELLHLVVKIGRNHYPAMVDCGASCTFLASGLKQMCQSVGIQVFKGKRTVICSPLGSELVDEYVKVPLEIENHVGTVKAVFLSSMNLPIIIGLDALHIFGMQIDFQHMNWYFASHPLEPFDFVSATEAQIECARLSLDAMEFCGLQELRESESEDLKQFLATHLPKKSDTFSCTDLIEHNIDVGDEKPLKQPWYQISPIVEKALYKELDSMLEQGVIERCESEWSNPVVMVKKEDKYRFCLDFRKVNMITKKDVYPIPLMSNILDKLKSAMYISKIDLSKAFHQIPLTKESKAITAFRVPGKGLFQFTRMPFGLTNAPATFQRLMDKLIGPELEPHVFAYLDDIIIVTEDFQDHLVWLKLVLETLEKAGLVINPDKSEFCCSEVKYLGYLVNHKGLQVDPEKLGPIETFPAPKTVTQVRRFVGMASWYRRFIPDFSTKVEPINRLIAKGTKFIWGPEQQTAFDLIKRMLLDAPILKCPDFTQRFYLQTDASNVGLGAVLSQGVKLDEKIVAYASRTLNKAERNYCTTELECLAIVWAVEKFRGYLEGSPFTVITDHNSLLWLHKLRNPSGRLARWAMRLLSYDITVIHRKGNLHHVPDALSRMYESEEDEVRDIPESMTSNLKFVESEE